MTELKNYRVTYQFCVPQRKNLIVDVIADNERNADMSAYFISRLRGVYFMTPYYTPDNDEFPVYYGTDYNCNPFSIVEVV